MLSFDEPDFSEESWGCRNRCGTASRGCIKVSEALRNTSVQQSRTYFRIRKYSIFVNRLGVLLSCVTASEMQPQDSLYFNCY